VSGGSVLRAIYDAGYNSSGRFMKKSTNMLGMTPTQFKTGGANENSFRSRSDLPRRNPGCIKPKRASSYRFTSPAKDGATPLTAAANENLADIAATNLRN